MPPSSAIPEQLLTVVAASTVFTVMFVLGLGIVLSEFRWVWGRPGLVAKGLFSVLIAVPALALIVTRAFDLGRAAQIGIVLMAISPGAPVALRRSLSAGGHRAFAPALQILVALLAVVSMPLSIAVLNELYVGHAAITPGHLARQVFTAQLLPLGLGMFLRRVSPLLAAWLEADRARKSALFRLRVFPASMVDVVEDMKLVRRDRLYRQRTRFTARAHAHGKRCL